MRKTDHPDKIRVLIADDHPIVRGGLRISLSLEPSVEVVGEAADGFAAMEAVRRLGPDILLLDVNLPKLHGREVATELTKSHPNTRIIALTMHNSQTYLTQMRRAGARGYVVKESPIEELMHAILVVHKGGSYFNSEAMDQDRGAVVKTPELTQRESEILRLLSVGKDNPEIASTLGVSIRTVEKHKDHLFLKTGCRNVAGLTRYCLSIGLIPPQASDI